MAPALKKTVIQTPQRATEVAAPEDVGGDGGGQISSAASEDLSQLILALHLDMVQMHEAQSAEIRGLRDEVKRLKDELGSILQSAKPSGDIWGI